MPEPEVYVGIDPGVSGVIVRFLASGVLTTANMMRLDRSEAEIAQFLRETYELGRCHVFLEQVGSMPKQGVTSAFTFGRSYGFCRGMIIGLGMPLEDVTPQKWMKAMGCMTGGDKKISQAKAQLLFPNMVKDITQKNADGILIAELCRRVKTGQVALVVSDAKSAKARGKQRRKAAKRAAAKPAVSPILALDMDRSDLPEEFQ